MKKIILKLFLFTLITCNTLIAQNKVMDSLFVLLNKTPEDSNKVILYNQLFFEFEFVDIQKAKEYNQLAAELSKKINYKKGIARSHISDGYMADDTGNYVQALIHYEKALLVSKEIKNLEGISAAQGNIGLIFNRQGKYSEALQRFFYVLKIAEYSKNDKALAATLNNIGEIYRLMYKFDESLNYQFKALTLFKKQNNKYGEAGSLGNIGIIFSRQGKYSEALDYQNKALEKQTEIANKQGIANAYNNLAFIYNKLNKIDLSLENYFKSLKVKEEIGDKQGISSSLISIGEIYSQQRKYSLAMDYILQGLEIAKSINAKEWLRDGYLNLSGTNKKLKKFEEALKNYESYILYRDSLVNEEIDKKTVQTSLTYQFEKKEAYLKAQQEKKDIITSEEKRKQKIVIYLVSIVLLFVLVFSIFLYRSYKQKQLANEIITKQKNEVEKAKDIIETQKHLVEEKNKEILDSIIYAKRLQEAILPPQKLVKQYLENSFILYKPKDIVAGDFYWLEAKNDLVLFAAADCTGHGVPGAMVSVVCSNALNRAVKEFGITEPGKILDKVKELVLETFEKSESDVKDGMDVSLCGLNLNAKKLYWSGANNPLWIIRNNELIEYSPDKQPIGKTDTEKNFFTHEIELQNNDSIYIFTDGYVDQFGGEKGKKLKSTNFKKLLLSINTENMSSQREKINQEFESWRGDLEQVDDVCVIGVRV